MTDRDLMRQALDALEECMGWTHSDLTVMAAETLRARLAQPEPEPHGYLWFTRYMEQRFTHRKPEERERIGDVKPVFAAPQKREWQGLTQREQAECWYGKHCMEQSAPYEDFARAIEAKLREKNT